MEQPVPYNSTLNLYFRGAANLRAALEDIRDNPSCAERDARRALARLGELLAKGEGK